MTHPCVDAAELHALKQEGLDLWRRLTSTNAPPPRVFVEGNKARILFHSPGVLGPADASFTASWRMPRGPGAGYGVTSCVIGRKMSDKETRTPKGGDEAVVISGAEWRLLATGFLDVLAPRNSMQGVYFQAFLSDGVVYRDPNGRPQLALFGAAPDDVEIIARYSFEETLGLSAEYFAERLLDRFPGRRYFVLMANNPRGFTSPVLIDVDRKRCVWMNPASIQDAAEEDFTFSLTLEALQALVIESHVVALVKNPVSSAFRLADVAVATAGRWLPLRLPKLTGKPPPLSHAPGMNLNDWENWMDEYTGTRRVEGKATLLLDGDQFFSRIDAAFRNATNHIWAQMFIFDRDDVGVGIADVLKQRAEQLQVRVLHDRLGTISGGLSPPATPLPPGFAPPASMHAYLRQQSRVHVRTTLNPWLTHNHSKVILADGHQAWLGGMNFGREYRYEWHDAMVEVTGPVVGTLERDFRRSWAHSGWLGDLAYIAKLITTSGKTNVPPSAASPGVRLLPTRTAWKPFAAALYGTLRQAQNHIYLENPYLFDKRTIRGLAAARQRGVDVRVILPRVNDFVPGERASLVVANYLLASGVRVYFYPGMTHTKALLADHWACVGSANYNHLSLRVNHEQNVATTDPEFVSDVRTRLFEVDFARSLELQEPVNVDWLDLVTNVLLEGP